MKKELTEQQRIELENSLANMIFPDDLDLDAVHESDSSYFEALDKGFDRLLDTVNIQNKIIEQLRNQVHTLTHLNNTLLGIKDKVEGL